MTDRDPRQRLGAGLTGRVLEVGPGTTPFPTAAGATVEFADRPIDGGRDDSFPELIGTPRGPDADHSLDIDRDGLGSLTDRSFDGVVLCHVIEHTVATVTVLQECERVLLDGGRLVLVVPLRHGTFDRHRPPTTLAHLVAEHRAGVTELDEDHIREFCASVYAEPPMHPEAVREWHNPDRLDADAIARHRQRSIHAHCWDAEEFAATLVGLLALDLLHLRLVDVFVPDDPGALPAEFGFALERTAADASTAPAFVEAWVRAMARDGAMRVDRIASFTAALARDLPGVLGAEEAEALVALPSRVLAELVVEARVAGEVRAAEDAATQAALATHVDEALRALDALRTSRTHRAGRVVMAPVRLLRRGGEPPVE